MVAVFRGEQHARDAGRGALDGPQHAGLAQHVVRGGRQRRSRRAAQHVPVGAAGDEEVQVRVTVADSLGLDPTFAEPVAVEEGLERAPDDQRRVGLGGGLLGGVDDVGGAHRRRILSRRRPR